MSYKKIAFTLVELLVVITIIGVLSAISVAVFKDYKQGARNSTRFSRVNFLGSAIQGYYYGNAGELPPAPTKGACFGLEDGQKCWGDLGWREAEGDTDFKNAMEKYVDTTAEDISIVGWGDNYYYYEGQLSRGCRAIVPDDPRGLFVIWRPEEPPRNDDDCLNMGFFSCCSGTPFCASLGGYFCAYQAVPQ